MAEEMYLELRDVSWPMTYTDHDRPIARGILVDDEGMFYFVRCNRGEHDRFGKATLIETSGGGIEAGESPEEAIHREMKEEMGVEVEILEKIGVVSDYYNLIHRHNINHYFLCRILSFGKTNMTRDEIEKFRLSTLKMSYEEAAAEYERCKDTPIGILVYNREMPVLERARELLDNM